MNVRPVLAVVVLCCLSLAGWEPVRVAEQALSPLLAPGAGWLRDALADGEQARLARRHEPALAAEADAIWNAWCAELLRRPAPARPGVGLALAPVLDVSADGRELLIAVPERAVAADAAVTWRGSLLGFLRPWRKDGERVDVGGRARVALLGHELARPVAAQWSLGAAAHVDFLLTGGEDGPRLQSASQQLDPLPGTLAWSRDMASLGDHLPGGLLLGCFDRPDGERPGGGVDGGPPRLRPLADPATLGHVVVEVAPPGATAPSRRVEGRLMPAAGSRRVRVDRGLLDGVREGDLVVQGAVLVGLVETAGPFASVVRTGALHGRLLVPDDEGRVVAVTPEAEGWPAEWRPRPGQPAFGGHREHGGFHAGTLAGARAGRLELLPPPVDLSAPVAVLGP